MDDAYRYALSQVNKPASGELVTGFKEKIEFIKARYKHSEKSVSSCLAGLGGSPTLLELLVAAFVVNGGILFKHGPSVEEEEQDENELSKLIQEIENLTHQAHDDDQTLESESGA
jgi:hypothetical protein